ncbi:MAG: PDZ domain-containing protein [Verrucomicrobia bacterium]|nr:MAG: PDZ domain-containing protein [Verrucomicrobiota bacterium]
MMKKQSAWRIVAAGLPVLLGVWTAAAAGATEPEDPRIDAAVRAVAKVMPAVVNIGTETIVQVRDPLDELFEQFWGPYYRRRPPEAQYSLGSGVIIDETGYVLTNDHVTRRASRIWVKLSEEAGGKTYEAELVASDPVRDVALLRLQCEPGERFTAAKFAEDDDLYLGETVLALGNPFGLGGSVSRGILSSKSRRPPKEGAPLGIEDWLQTDAAINPGNSGGPLINLRGELIGLNVAVFSEGQGIGFAIPIKQVGEALADMFAPAIGRLWFGARVRPAPDGVRVDRVEPDSPAAQAGLQAGDLITHVKGHPVHGFIEFMRELQEAGAGRPVAVRYRREGREARAEVRLVPESEVFNAGLIRRRTGMELQELTPELARHLGLWGVRGLLVADVEPGSPADRLGIEPGHVLLGVDGQPADDLVRTARLLHGKAAGERVPVVLLISSRRGGIIFHQRVAGALKLR